MVEFEALIIKNIAAVGGVGVGIGLIQVIIDLFVMFKKIVIINCDLNIFYSSLESSFLLAWPEASRDNMKRSKPFWRKEKVKQFILFFLY